MNKFQEYLNSELERHFGRKIISPIIRNMADLNRYLDHIKKIDENKYDFVEFKENFSYILCSESISLDPQIKIVFMKKMFYHEFFVLSVKGNKQISYEDFRSNLLLRSRVGISDGSIFYFPMFKTVQKAHT